MENNKPRTIDEFFIQKYEELEKRNEQLIKNQEMFVEINNNLGDERDEYKNKYIELISRLKEEFKPEIKTLNIYGKYYISLEQSYTTNQEQYNYYKELFNLKEEGENKNEQ